MNGDKQVIQLLNRQLTRELTAVNQCFLHARMRSHWGLKRLGEHGKVGAQNYLQSQMEPEEKS